MSATAVLLHPPDRRLFADDITFQVDVSRTYRNKEGYDAGGYKLNVSFRTESHTGASFIDDVIRQGWPYTMVHLKRSPEETGAAARKVVTPKHIENFVSSQLLTGDDDSKLPGVIDWWWRDPFFSRYGWFFAESVNSVSGEAEKGHPTLLFDQPITDPALYKDCLRAFCFAYPRLDHLTNIDRTIYNAQEARVHILGNVCPFAVFEQEILTPWRIAEAEKLAAIEAEQARRLAARNGNGHATSSNHLHAYLAGYTRWLFGKVAGKRKGDNRNMAIYWAGRAIAGIEATPWAGPYLDALGDVAGRIVDAAAANGYLAEYAHNDPVEVVRIFERGRAAGGEPLDEPEARPMPVTVSPGANGAAPGTAVPEPPANFESELKEMAADPNLGLRIRPLADLLAQDFPPLKFWVDGLIAEGHLVMLGGRPKSGKSWLTLQLAQAIDQGFSFLGRDTRRGRVLLIALEDGQRRVNQRANIIRWRPDNASVCFEIAHFNGDGKTVDIGPGLKQLEAVAADYDLVIVDTLIATLNGRANENDNASMGAVVNELARIAHTTNAAVVVVHHTGKGSAENVFDLLRGASALRGGYDVGLLLERKQDEREAILHVESRDFDATSMTIRQSETGEGWECLGNGRYLTEIRAGRAIVSAIQQHGEGLTAKELAEATGKSEQTIRNQLNNAEAKGLVRQEKEDREKSLKPVAVWYLSQGGINI